MACLFKQSTYIIALHNGVHTRAPVTVVESGFGKKLEEILVRIKLSYFRLLLTKHSEGAYECCKASVAC